MDQVYQTKDAEDRDICFQILRSVTLTFRRLSMVELTTTIELPPELLDSDVYNLIELYGFFVTVREGVLGLG